MGFPQLLAANRSLRNIRNGPSRYKMTQANLLPRFGAESEAAGRAPVPVAGVPVGRAVKAAGSRGLPAPLAGSPAPVPRFAPRLAQAGGRSWWRRLAHPFGGGAGGVGQGAVQSELMLGTVEPVRNQLGENDLELGPAPGAAAAALDAAGGAAGEAVAGVRPALWRRWVGRFLSRLGQDRA
jgi:hypothetical protein